MNCGFIMPNFSEKVQTKMQILPWALLWAIHIVCISSLNPKGTVLGYYSYT